MQVRQQAHTPTTRCCTQRKIGPMDVADEASRCAMEATEVIPTAILDPPETGGVEAMKTGKGNPSRNAGTVARKVIGTASVGRSSLIRREPGLDPVPDIPTKEIGNDRTTPKDPEKGQSS